MGIIHCYVSLPEGRWNQWSWLQAFVILGAEMLGSHGDLLSCIVLSHLGMCDGSGPGGANKNSPCDIWGWYWHSFFKLDKISLYIENSSNPVLFHSIIIMFVLRIPENIKNAPRSCTSNKLSAVNTIALSNQTQGISLHVPPHRASVISIAADVLHHVATSFDAESNKYGHHDPQDMWKDNEKHLIDEFTN